MKKTILTLVFAYCAMCFGNNAKAAVLLSPVGTVYQSSQFSSAYSATNLFYSAQNGLTTSDFGTTNHLVVQFAASDMGGSPARGDANPIVAFDLGSNATVSSFGYAQRGIIYDAVTSISLWSLTQSQYATYTASLETSPQSGGGSSGGPKSAPSLYNYYSGAITVSDTNLNFNQNSITSTTGRYWVVQFSAKGGNSFANPGGAAFNLVGSIVPEPSTYALFGFGSLALVIVARRRVGDSISSKRKSPCPQ